MRLTWRCPHCRHEDRLSPDELKSRLRELGMLKRGDRGDAKRGVEYEVQFLLQLAQAARARLLCGQCDSGGCGVEVADDRDEWEPPPVPCAACGAAIPPERIELFPASQLCAACQQRVDRGQSPDKHDDFCPRCGSRMTVRQRRGSGIAGYELTCPDCRR